MANCQNEPLFDIATNLSHILQAQFPSLKTIIIGWPDMKLLQVDSHLPLLAIVDISEQGRHAVPVSAVSGYTPIVAGQGQVLTERMRLHTLVQLSLFCATQAQRDALGWQIKQWLCVNQHLQILDYTIDPPAPVQSGEYMLLYYRGDHRAEKGSANFYRRDLTFEIQARVLDATPGYQVATVNETLTTGPVVSAAPTPSPKLSVISQSSSTDAHGNPVDTISAT